MDIVNEFHKGRVVKQVADDFEKQFIFELLGSYDPIERAVCNDGFTVSIQAGDFLHCVPRKNSAWPYAAFELGYPSELDPLIEKYAEDYGTERTVFNWVPVDVVVALINKHGGFKND